MGPTSIAATTRRRPSSTRMPVQEALGVVPQISVAFRPNGRPEPHAPGTRDTGGRRSHACDGTPCRAGRRGMDGVLRVVVSGDREFDAPPVHDPSALIRPGLIGWRRCFVAVPNDRRVDARHHRRRSSRSLPTPAKRGCRDHAGRCRLLGCGSRGDRHARQRSMTAAPGPAVLERHGRMTIDGTPGRHAAPYRPRRARPRLDVLTDTRPWTGHASDRRAHPPAPDTTRPPAGSVS